MTKSINLKQEELSTRSRHLSEMASMKGSGSARSGPLSARGGSMEPGPRSLIAS
jgi:hypothetical protein